MRNFVVTWRQFSAGSGASLEARVDVNRSEVKGGERELLFVANEKWIIYLLFIYRWPNKAVLQNKKEGLVKNWPPETITPS